MLEGFKSYLHRLIERLKFYRAHGRETVFTIVLYPNAMKLSWRSSANEIGEIVVPWQDIIQIQAFKRDLYAVDLICLANQLIGNKTVEINEEMDGWESLVNELPEYLSGCKEFEGWFLDVAFPAFKPNVTSIYERAA